MDSDGEVQASGLLMGVTDRMRKTVPVVLLDSQDLGMCHARERSPDAKLKGCF